MKYNKAEIMKSAWAIRKAESVTMGEALKKSWNIAKLTVGANPMDDTVQEYFRRLEAADKAMKALEEIKAVIQDACMESPDFCISGFGWNASYKPVTSNRLDSKALKADHANIYAAYTKAQTSRRFLCKPVAVPA